MAGDFGGWLKRIIRKGHRNGSNGNGNGEEVLPANRLQDRESSAIAIQEGIRDLSVLLKGIELRLKAQNEHGQRVTNRLELLAEAFRSIHPGGEKSEAILDAIREEVHRQGEMGKEVAGYFQSLPRILKTLESGGTVRQAQLDVARNLVSEISSQGRQIATFQKGASELAGSVRRLSEVGEEQLDSLQGIERGIRSAMQQQVESMDIWGRRYRRAAIGVLSLIGVGLILTAGAVTANVIITQGMFDKMRATVAAEPVVTPDQEAILQGASPEGAPPAAIPGVLEGTGGIEPVGVEGAGGPTGAEGIPSDADEGSEDEAPPAMKEMGIDAFLFPFWIP